MADLAVSINTHVLAALATKAPKSYQDSFIDAAGVGLISSDLARAIAPSAGLRNVLVHEYLDIDLTKVALSVAMAKDYYRRYVTEVAHFLLEHQ